MLSALRRKVIPGLREAGFTGTFPHFRRYNGDSIDLITFQTNKYGGSFLIELSAGFPYGSEKNYRLFGSMTEKTLNVYATNIRYRLPGTFGGPWFYYSDDYKSKKKLRFGTRRAVDDKDTGISEQKPEGASGQTFDEATAEKLCDEINRQLKKGFRWLEEFKRKHAEANATEHHAVRVGATIARVNLAKNGRGSLRRRNKEHRMENSKKSALRRITDKFYGGLNMSWPAVILFAVGTAILTAVFMIVPAFRNTSFERMGVTFEAWVFFAVVIMANCKSPLDSALKTFVFFLISQPLIYLLQVPFSSMGWGLFGYYKYWFLWTLGTFPMAFVGWYITKKNWISLLILAPILCLLTNEYIGCFQQTIRHFPRLIVTAVFCLAQVLLYLYAFTEKLWQRLLGFLVPLILIGAILLLRPQVDFTATNFLPDDPVLTESAVVEVEDPDTFEISVAATGTDSMIRVSARKFGTTSFVIRDGETEYRYTLEVYEDEGGHLQLRILPKE